ncbi:MAG: hydrogenase iron-sulfur subunit [Clostridia bacterium]|nr:hydrogenase iron-sulfur subunit [Clostridia bacterium]
MITAFACFRSAYLATDQAVITGLLDPSEVNIVRVPCSGRVEVRDLLRAFRDGADGVLVLACPEGSCQDLTGNVRARQRVEYAQRLLEEIGIEKERLEMAALASMMVPQAADVIKEMLDTVRALGPCRGRVSQAEGVAK